VPHLVDDFFDAEAGRATRDHDGTQTFLAALPGVGPDNTNIYVCALLVPVVGPDPSMELLS
jgi:hypothetical protein